MHFTSIFAPVILAVAFALSAQADTIVAFSGSQCDGAVGNTVQCDGSCHQFSGRHSLRISGGSTHCVTYFTNNNCGFAEGQGGTNIFGPGTCQNVNTGGNVGSFLCAPSTICLV
ncbi:hypothetical protein GALMADRAFT_229967 [Galerina marginata CBS 339.88]|uniref:Uncharacterized protein n=1 Tax=Galerina marginata (strain CBS 339.88) TaxID=685588 RepID=A0A067SIA9_GALM3|nr:hypothetical protein GALMADRAFT_229967 [Galerina marginata CBS 339.88]